MDKKRERMKHQWVGVRTLFGYLLCVAGLVVVGMPALVAQTSTILQIPRASAVVGIPSGSSATVCGSSIATKNALSDGDGCPALQATLSSPQSVAVDSYGNIYIADDAHDQLRVVYNGNPALAAAIIGAYGGTSKLPAVTVGDIYTIGGGCGSSGTSGCYTNTGAGGGGADGTFIVPSSVALDGDGNIFLTDSSNRVRVIYVGGTKVRTLLYNTGLAVATTLTAGYEYPVISSSTSGYAGDGSLANANAETNGVKSIVIDSNENVYLSDYNNYAVRKITASTGLISTFVGGPGCVVGTKSSCTSGTTGNGGAATSAETYPYALALDANGNLYVGENSSGQVRAVYNGRGSLPGVSSPQSGYIYLIAGSGTATTSGSLATSTKFSSVGGLGFDGKGNLYVLDKTTNELWEIDAATQIATIIAGGGSATTASSACPTTPNQTSTDTVGDGCLGTEAKFSTSEGNVAFDPQGNIYITDNGNNLIRELSRVNQYATTATGSTSSIQTLGFASLASQTLGAMKIGVQGALTTDFTSVSTGTTCASGLVLTSGGTCLLNLEFTPTLPGYRDGFVGFTNSSATSLGTFYAGGAATGAEVAVDSGTQTQVGQSPLEPLGVAVDASGNIYVADEASSSLLQYASSTATTASATLITGLSSTAAQVAVDGKGNVSVADAGNNRVAVYNKQASSVSYLTSYPTYNATTGGTSTVTLSGPKGVAADNAGDLYVADTGNNAVVEFYAGGGTRVLTTSVTGPTRVALDGSGNVYVLDPNAGTPRVVEIPSGTGTQTTVNTSSYAPVAFAVDTVGDVYVLDSSGLQVGVVLISGTTSILYNGLVKPSDVALDALGDVYIADEQNASVIVLNRQNASIGFGALNLTTTSAASSFTLTDIGNANVLFTGPGIASGSGSTAEFSTTASATNGCSSTTLDAGTSCSLSSTFTPQAITGYSETLTFPSNASSADDTIVQLSGTGVLLNRTAVTVSLASPSNSSTLMFGTPLTFSISLSVLTGIGTPTGTFNILVNGVIVQSKVSIGNGTVSYSATPQAGLISISAIYSGDSQFASSNGTLSVTIAPVATTTALTIVGNLSSTTPNLVLNVLVSSAVPGVSGLVTFSNGSTVLGITTINTQGVASITVTSLALSILNFSATYNGTSNYAASTSSIQSVSGDFGLTSALNLTVPQGGIASGNVVVTPYFGLSGTVQFVCSGLPEDSSCRVYPQTISFTGENDPAVTVQVQIFTDLSPTIAMQNARQKNGNSHPLHACFVLAALCLMFVVRRSGLMRRGVLYSVCLAAVVLGAMSGCSNSSSPTYTTQTGTYPVTLTVTAANGASHITSIDLVVTAN